MRDFDHRVYRSFQEFEREELRRFGTPVDEMLSDIFGEELDFDSDTVRRSAARDRDDDEE